MRRFRVTFLPVRLEGPNTTGLSASRPSVCRLGLTEATSKVWANVAQCKKMSAVTPRIALIRSIYRNPAALRSMAGLALIHGSRRHRKSDPLRREQRAGGRVALQSRYRRGPHTGDSARA